ncbi:MAG: FkbM family methyltransferase [Lachnospiraceae bacterium]|nr:FkbM family methyltransferase [Lachnospiraceae bacterium]
MNIKKEENVFVTEINKARAEGKKVIVLGGALGAVRIVNGLKFKGLDADAFAVDKEYYEPGRKLMDKDVLCLDDLDPAGCIIIRSIANYPKKEELNGRFHVIDEDVQSLSMVSGDPFDLVFFEANSDKFNTIFESLSDEKSKTVMTSFINQKITGRFSEMADIWDEIQYFDCDFYDISSVDCIVDCGAYDGDSFLSFCNEYKKSTGKDYEGEGYLLDPDHTNQEKIKERFRNSPATVHAMEMGAWDESGTLSFDTDGNIGNSGKISDHGSMSIKVEAIDNMLSGKKADFIKMDIEGAELNALKGAEKTIKEYHPILAVCAYHKREDLIELTDYIKSLYSGYRFFVRAYGGPYSIELVLYAVA